MDVSCDVCLAPEWTNPAYSKRAILQIGCWRCYSVYYLLDDGPMLFKKDPRNPIFWKDLKRQWDEALEMKR